MLDTPRPFFDLRAFASSAAARAAERAGEPGDAYLGRRHLLHLDDGPVTCGVIALPAGSGRMPASDADEFVIALDGEVNFGGNLKLRANESAVLPAGASQSWSTDGPATLVFMRYEVAAGGSDGDRAPVAIDEGAPLQPSGAPLAELLIGSTPDCRNHTDFCSMDGTFVCGTWDSTPYHRRPMFYRHHELMHLLDGSVTFEDEDGSRATFERGDIFIVRRGARCSWESRVPVKKVYAIYRPAAQD
jgi:uncharacterized cupin superfamily protein